MDDKEKKKNHNNLKFIIKAKTAPVLLFAFLWNSSRTKKQCSSKK